jgi:alkanesulfonate monooxygenase SsuD/methylene tetrahydromethanopterin reductase-like flavin-dependent oxidoreductase (luciferase family)
VRLGLVLDPASEWAAQSDAARRADELGFDLLWVEAGNAIQVSALAGVTESIRVGLRLPCGAHPVTLAEEAAVADQLLGGRLVLTLAVGEGGVEQLIETLEVVLASHAPRPFCHDGPQWTVPGNFPDNVETESRIRVTPTPAQIEMPVWVTGAGAAAVAAEFGVSYVGGADDASVAMVEAWAAIEAALGPAATRMPRPARRRFADDLDAADALAALDAEHVAWGMDLALLDVPASALDIIARTHNPTRS